MNKKKTLLVVACAALMMIGAATMAYFTDSEKATNTFSVGNVDITLDEKDVDNFTPGENDRDTSNKYKLIPGCTYEKDPTIHVAADSGPCWIYATVEVSEEFSDIEAAGASSIANQMAANGWSLVEGTDDVYAYKKVVSAEDDIVIFSSITIDGDKANNDAIAKIDQNTMIKVTGYAIQATGFDTATAAWNTAYKQFN